MAYQPPTDLQLRDPEFNKKTKMSIVPATPIRASTGPSASSVKCSSENSPQYPAKKISPCPSTTSHQPFQPLAVPPNARKEGRSQCPICGKKPNCSLRRHALAHLPWYGDPVKVCWERGEHFTQHGNLRKHLTNWHPNGGFHNHTSRWVTLLANFFHIIARSLKLATVEDLVPYVIQHHLFPDPGEPSLEDKEMMHLFDITSHCIVPSGPYCYSPPNSIAALTHWKIMVLLLQQLDLQYKQYLFAIRFSMVSSASGFPAPTPGISSIFEIHPAPMSSASVTITSSSGPSQDRHSKSSVPASCSGPPQDHRSSSLAAGVFPGPSQEPSSPSAAATSSSGPPQDCPAHYTVTVGCPPQDRSQSLVSTPSPSQDPWSILGSSATSDCTSEAALPTPKTTSSISAIVNPVLPAGQWSAYRGVDTHFHPDKLI